MKFCDMLHENNVMFRDTDILPDNAYTQLIMEEKHVHNNNNNNNNNNIP